jgi:hypothetical protein
VRQDDRGDTAPDLTRLGGSRGDGWFAYAGGADADQVRVPARRFAQSVLFDLSATDPSREHDGTLTLRAATAAEALHAWNAVVAR